VFPSFLDLEAVSGEHLKTMLTIAGFDPSSGAGVTADLMVFAAEGFFGTSCIAALTVQSTVGVRSTHAVDSRILAQTLECLWDDLPAAGIKIGMLGTAENVAAVADFLQAVRAGGGAVPVVLDPVVRSSSGSPLLDEEATAVLRERLLPLVDWVTPNLAELEVLAAIPVRTPVEMEDGARRLQDRYAGLGVVVTGGHLDPVGVSADDLVVPAGSEAVWLRGERIESRSTHGTGCAFSSAMACGLARGLAGTAAAQAAKDYLSGALRHAEPMGRGNGPMNLAWRATGQQ
jgi:hydroxymethylpyrimidine/phosphomethylpyrimidine kinase